MTISFHRRGSISVRLITLIVLLAWISCREGNQPVQKPVAVHIANRALLDSLIPACKAMFIAVQKDTSRKNLLARAHQLMEKVERLAEQEQSHLDSLGRVVENQAYTYQLVGDTARGRMRMEYAKQLYRRTGDLKALAHAQFSCYTFYNTGPSLASKLAVLDTASRLALESRDTMQYLTIEEKRALLQKKAGQKDTYHQTLLDLLAFKKKHFPVNIPQTSYYLGNYYESEGKSAEAFKYRQESVHYLSTDSARGFPHSYYYQLLGYCYFDLGKYDAAKQCFEKGYQLIVTTEASKQPKETADAITWILACYAAERRFEEGIAYAQKAIQQYPPVTYRDKAIFAQGLLDLHLNTGKYAQAGEYVAELLRDVEMIPENARQYSFELAGRYYLTQRDLSNAKLYLLKALDIAQKNRDISSLIEDSRHLFKVDSLAGRYQAAIRWYQDYKGYLDKKRLKTQNKEIRELDIKYETEKKAAAVKGLMEKTNLQQSLIHQASFAKNLSLTVAVLLLLVLGILYNRYQLRQRVNKKLQENQEKINQQNKALEQLVADERKLSTEKTELLQEKSQLLEEKDWLLKEVHHRVKNNLQIMMCLLESQSMYLENDALKALEDSQRRLYAMSLIHQKLYQSEDIHILNMERYMREFVHYLKESLDVSNRTLFTLNIAPVELSVTQAIPLALIMNEAVTNSIKYAFPDNRRGEISIILTESGGEIELQLADNGVGLPSDVWQGKRNSLGMELIKGLCTEIKGTIMFQSQGGTRIIIRFRRAVFQETVYPAVSKDLHA